MIFNPAGFASRYRLYREFSERMLKRGVVFHTVELAMGDQDFAITDADNPHHYRLRTDDTLWYKENLINVAIGRLPADWEYVAWIDADVSFARPDWPEETIANLKKHAFVQMFSRMIDLGPKYRAISVLPSFASNLPAIRDLVARHDLRGAANAGLPGLAWAGRRKEIEAVGGLIDWDIVGGNDSYMALALTGQLTGLAPAGLLLSDAFRQSLFDWQEKAATVVRGGIGCNDDMALHYWHGNRQSRGYEGRNRILLNNAFDPHTDLVRDAAGLLRFAGNKPDLDLALRQYFTERRDDEPGHQATRDIAHAGPRHAPNAAPARKVSRKAGPAPAGSAEADPR